MKRGQLSREEKYKIDKWLKQDPPMSVEEVAKKLKRHDVQIRNYAKRFYGIGVEESPAKNQDVALQAEMRRELRSRSEWKNVKESFRDDELDYYEELYGRLMSQFRDDILPTEELQVFQAIAYQIYMNRHMRSRKMAEDEILRLDTEIENLRSEDPDGNKNEIATLEAHRQVHIANSSKRTDEFTKLSKKFEEIIEKLKGTREQRIKNIESSTQTFVGLIKVLQDKKVREREGRHMELRRIATDKARRKLKEPHQYINKEWDNPLLTAEDEENKDVDNN